MDWNNDGKKDLLTGENNGNVRIYLNTNTDEDPVFSGYTLLQQGGSNFDCGSYSMPHVMDWNNDGKKDLICGESNGRVYLLINTGSDENPVFNTKVLIQDGAATLDVGSVCAPTTVDLNRDGKKDLLIGETYGSVFFFENMGTDDSPAFDGSVPLKVGSSYYDVGYYARPDVTDWDNDGVMDIVCGTSDGYVNMVHARGPLILSANQLAESTGGKIELGINAGGANGGRVYMIFGSVSGTSPGTPLPGGLANLPINWDIFTSIVIGLTNTTMFDNFAGILGSSGRATAVLNIGAPIPGTAGLVMSFAYTLKDPYDFASNGACIEIVP